MPLAASTAEEAAASLSRSTRMMLLRGQRFPKLQRHDTTTNSSTTCSSSDDNSCSKSTKSNSNSSRGSAVEPSLCELRLSWGVLEPLIAHVAGSAAALAKKSFFFVRKGSNCRRQTLLLLLGQSESVAFYATGAVAILVAAARPTTPASF
ncbi:hypothetical protein ACSSS7_002434 [Eimeria intestinalis]